MRRSVRERFFAFIEDDRDSERPKKKEVLLIIVTIWDDEAQISCVRIPKTEYLDLETLSRAKKMGLTEIVEKACSEAVNKARGAKKHAVCFLSDNDDFLVP